MIPVPQRILAQLAASHGLSPADLNSIGGGGEESDGVVYAYPHGEGRRLLKVMAIPAEDQVRGLFCLDERLRYAHYLAKNGARTVRFVHSPSDHLYETTQGDDFLWVAYAMEIAPGHPMSQRAWNKTLFDHWGEAVGQTHRLATEYPSWRSSVHPESGQEYLTWREELHGFVRWCLDEKIKAKWLEMESTLNELPVERDSFGFIHNDPHGQNLIVAGYDVTLIDFDVANHHWFVADIATASQSILLTFTGGFASPVWDRDKLRFFYDAFMSGYRREYDLGSEWLDRLDLFIQYRRLLLFTVMQGYLSRRAPERQSWKQMILTAPAILDRWED